MSDTLQAPSVNDGKVTKEAILAWIQEWTRANNLNVPSDLDQTFADAGLDSMHSVELAFFLEERIKIKVDDTVLYDYPTFASLAAYLVSQIKPADTSESELGALSSDATGGSGSW